MGKNEGTAKISQRTLDELKGQSAAVQPDINLCRICEEYMADEQCERAVDGSCPVASVMNQLREAKQSLKKRDKELAELRKQLEDMKFKMSYMINPMEIGDRHEMGG